MPKFYHDFHDFLPEFYRDIMIIFFEIGWEACNLIVKRVTQRSNPALKFHLKIALHGPVINTITYTVNVIKISYLYKNL